jgi:hypothetical protein
MKNFIKEMFSMQEKRISTIIVSLVACMALAFYLYISRMDIPETLKTIILTQTYIIGGVNGANILSKVIKPKTDEREDYNDG